MRKATLVIAMITIAFALSAQGQNPPMPIAGFATLTSVNGALIFIDDRPAIKTDNGTVFLAMPDFFKYAYLDGIKAGAAIKATGMLVPQPAPKPAPAAQASTTASSGSDKTIQPGQATLVATEVTIGAKTYIIVAGEPNSNRGHAGAPGSDRGPGPGDDRALNPEQGRK
jgi:hypothetical protein